MNDAKISIAKELLCNMKNYYVRYIPLTFYIASRMAVTNCDVTALAVAHCLEGSEIVSAQIRAKAGSNEYINHLWVEKDGFVIDGTTKRIESIVHHRNRLDIKDERRFSLQEFNKTFPTHTADNIDTKSKISTLSKAELRDAYKAMALVYDQVQCLNLPIEAKTRLLLMLTEGYDVEIISKLAEKTSPSRLNMARKQHPKSYLFQTGLNVTEKDCDCFH